MNEFDHRILVLQRHITILCLSYRLKHLPVQFPKGVLFYLTNPRGLYILRHFIVVRFNFSQLVQCFPRLQKCWEIFRNLLLITYVPVFSLIYIIFVLLCRLYTEKEKKKMVETTSIEEEKRTFKAHKMSY